MKTKTDSGIPRLQARPTMEKPTPQRTAGVISSTARKPRFEGDYCSFPLFSRHKISGFLIGSILIPRFFRTLFEQAWLLS